MVKEVVIFGAGNGGKAMAAELALRGMLRHVSYLDMCGVVNESFESCMSKQYNKTVCKTVVSCALA